jgi:hypothetical protein
VLVTIVIGVAIQDADKGIHRKFRDDWFVGIGSACFVFDYAINVFWEFRRSWRMWAALAALLIAFVGIVVPILSHIDSGKLGNVVSVPGFQEWLCHRRRGWGHPRYKLRLRQLGIEPDALQVDG